MCPHCGRDAPIVYRGVVPHCTACGGLRAPLSGPSVNLAGQPAKVGGVFASVAGVLVLVVGLPLAIGVWLLTFALATPGIAFALALPMALIALVVAGVLLGGGRTMRKAGDHAQNEIREAALLALAGQKGAVTAADAARIVGMSVIEADAILTAVAKREPDKLAVDIDDQGLIWFRAGGWGPHLRVGSEVRVDARQGDEAEADDLEAAPAPPAGSHATKGRR